MSHRCALLVAALLCAGLFHHPAAQAQTLPSTPAAPASAARAEMEWVRTYEGHGNSNDATGIALDAEGNVYVTGWSVVELGDNQYVTIKYDAAGNELWARTYDDAIQERWDESYAIAVDAEGSAYVTGRSWSSNGFRVVTIKYDTNGNEVWVRRSSVAEASKAIAVDEAGDIYVAGGKMAGGAAFVLTKYSPEGEELWVRSYESGSVDLNGGTRLAIGGDGGVYIAGTVYPEEAGEPGVDHLVVRYAADGTQEWARRYYNEMGISFLVVLAADDAGNVFVGGGNSADRRAVKMTPEGEVDWVATIGGQGGALTAMATDAEGSLFVGGIVGCGEARCFSVGKYDAEGTSLWEQADAGYGGLENVVYALAVDPEGNVYAGGVSEKAESVATDYVTAKYHTGGAKIWLERYGVPGGVSTLTALAAGADAAYVTGSSGGLITTIKYAGTDEALVVNPGSLDFGELFTGQTATRELTFSNASADPLYVTNIEASPEVFTTGFDGEQIELGAGQTASVAVSFAPETDGIFEGTLTISGHDAEGNELATTVALAGSAERPAEAAVSPASLALEVEAGQTGSSSLTLSNEAASGALELVFSASVATAASGRSWMAEAPEAAPLRPGQTGWARPGGSAGARSYVVYEGAPVASRQGGEVTITHSLSQEIAPDGGVACFMEGIGTAQNSFWRVFDLAEFDLTTFRVTSVTVGAEVLAGAGNPVTTTVRLYRLSGAFETSNLTLVGEGIGTVTDTGRLEVPVEAQFEAGDVLAVEWFVPGLEEVFGAIFPGSNAAGQTGPTYLSSEDCNLTEPMDVAELGFPDAHWVLSVHGSGDAPLLTVAPREGAVAPGQSQELTLTLDASDTEPGDYALEVVIATNDPERPTLSVPVAVTVTGGIASEEGALPLAFSLSPNYPNPFSGRTTIEFALPEASPARLSVFDASGRLVATLVDGEREAGFHEVAWEARGLASGVYFVRLEAGSYRSTQRMVLVQ